MKIVLTASGAGLEAPFDNRFGRASSFIVYDLDSDTFTTVDNRQNLNAAQGAGVQAAQTVSQLGARAVITGHCGPKAFRALSAAGIKVFSSDAPTVSAALGQYRAGQLTEIQSADVEGHWA